MKIALALLAAALSCGAPVRAAAAADEPPALEDACSSELGLLCRDASEGEAAFRCLREFESSATPPCRAALRAHAGRRERRAAQAQQAEAASQAAASGQAQPAPGAELEARLVAVSGAVYVHTSRQPADQFIAGEAGMPLAAGDVVRTGADGSAEIALDGESIVSLAAGSDFVLDSLQSSDASLFLGVGRLVAKLRKLVEGQKLRFVTQTAVAAVRGTELAVEQPEGEEASRVAVLDEGRVSVTAADGQGAVDLRPNQETEVSKGKKPAAPRPLATLSSAKASLAPLRARLLEVRKQWKSETRLAREQRRANFAQRPPLPGLNLPKVAPAQRQRSYPRPSQTAAPQRPAQERRQPQRAPPERRQPKR